MPDANQLDRLSLGHPENELIHALEPDQMVDAAARPLPRYRLSRLGNFGLWLLRGFVLAISALVIYTFVVAIR
jgi:hypothetical protein